MLFVASLRCPRPGPRPARAARTRCIATPPGLASLTPHRALPWPLPRPRRTGSRLPKLREIASEFYDPLPHHNSWTKVVWKYITDPRMGPFNRVKRRTIDDATMARLNPVAAAAVNKGKQE